MPRAKPNERNAKIKTGLFDLISNVILLRGRNAEISFPVRRWSRRRPSNTCRPETQTRLKAFYVDYFFRRQDDFWMREAMQKLPALKRVTNMLVCGEDLGVVPDCVPVAMKQLGLLSLEIQRMPKRLGQEFSRPADAPYLSVVTPSSHDMSTIRGWWEEDAKLTQKFYNQELGQPGEAPRQCEVWINRAIVDQHLASPAMWSIFQLQDLLGMDEKLRRADPARRAHQRAGQSPALLALPDAPDAGEIANRRILSTGNFGGRSNKAEDDRQRRSLVDVR